MTEDKPLKPFGVVPRRACPRTVKACQTGGNAGMRVDTTVPLLGRLNSPGTTAVYSGWWFSRPDVGPGLGFRRKTCLYQSRGSKNGRKQLINLEKLIRIGDIASTVREGALPANIVSYLLKVKQ